MSPGLEWKESVKVMNEFVVKMWRSGYPSSWRQDAVKSSIQMYEELVRDERSGKRPMFRPKEFMTEERRLEVETLAKGWTGGRCVGWSHTDDLTLGWRGHF